MEARKLLDTQTGGAPNVVRSRSNEPGREPPFVAVMTSVYVRRDAHWKLAVYQQTAKRS